MYSLEILELFRAIRKRKDNIWGVIKPSIIFRPDTILSVPIGRFCVLLHYFGEAIVML